MKLQHRRLRVKRLRTISLEDGWSEVDFYVHVKLRPKSKPATIAPVATGDYLDMQFSPVALWMSGGAVKGVCSFSETEWHVLKALVEAGADGVEYGELIGTVPGWDVEFTDDGAVKRMVSKISSKLEEAKFPFFAYSKQKRDQKQSPISCAFLEIHRNSNKDK